MGASSLIPSRIIQIGCLKSVCRAILAAKGIHRKVLRAVAPNAVKFVRVDGRVRPDGQDFTTGVTASIACIGNVGPGFGEVGSMSNYSAIPTVLKVSGMVEMLIGRLEIFPILYLFRSVRN